MFEEWQEEPQKSRIERATETLRGATHTLNGFFSAFNNLLQGTEYTLNNALTSIAIYIVLFMVGLVSYENAHNSIGYGVFQSALIGISMAVTGLLTVSTTFSHIRHNRILRSKIARRQLGIEMWTKLESWEIWVPLILYGIYLTLAYAINAMGRVMDTDEARFWATIAIVTLEIPVVVTAGIRNNRTEMLLNAQTEDDQLRTDADSSDSSYTKIDFRTYSNEVSNELLIELAQEGVSALRERLGISPENARRWRREHLPKQIGERGLIEQMGDTWVQEHYKVLRDHNYIE